MTSHKTVHPPTQVTVTVPEEEWAELMELVRQLRQHLPLLEQLASGNPLTTLLGLRRR